MSLLEVEKLTKSFAGLKAVSDVDVTVADGEFLGIVGPNGAGKTTLFSLLAGQLPPSSGRVVFDGRDITGWSADRVAGAGLVRTFQLMRPFESMSVLDNVAIAAHHRHRSRRAARRHALEVIERVRRPARCRPPASSGWSSPGHWPWSPGSCCSTRCWPAWCRRSVRPSSSCSARSTPTASR